MSNDLALIDKSELSLVENNSLNTAQLNLILKNTPQQYVHQRPAKGGGTWDYVTGGYVKKCLNLMFGWDWSFEIVDQQIIHNEVVVKGKLTCNSNGKTIVKMQFGNKDIIYKKGTEIPLSIGNDMKAAATDCLKKCAAEIGIAADIYNKEDFRAIQVVESDDILDTIKNLFELKRESMKSEDIEHSERIITEQEIKSYSKLLKQLKSI